MNLDILKNFGLTKNDLRVYEALIANGRCKTGVLIKYTNVVSSQVYESLNKLLNKGLISYQVLNNIRYYKAESLTPIKDDLKNMGTTIDDLSKRIKEVSIQKNERNETNTYEGRYGFRRAFVQHLDQCAKGNELQIIGFSPRFGRSRELRSFFNRLDESVKEKKLRVRLLIDKSQQDTTGKDKSKVSNYNVRYLPSGYFNPSAINISAHEVMFSVWGEEPIVFTIKNSLIIESFQQNFEYLWKKAK